MVFDHLSRVPAWLGPVLGPDLPPEGEARPAAWGTGRLVRLNGILRHDTRPSEAQAQTRGMFEYIWSGEERFRSDASRRLLSDWYRTNYGEVAEAPWWTDHGPEPLVVEAGCGAGLSGVGILGDRIRRVRYLGVDISPAVEAAAALFAEKGLPGAFLQADLTDLPLPDASVDVIVSQGVLHHTDSTRGAIRALVRKLKPGGRFLFYVYRRKGPIREFTDDHIRDRLQDMPPAQAWEAMMPLTRLGKLLGDLAVEVDIPEPIDLLGIPAGRIDLQRLFYWHVFKAFHHPELSLDELNHINLDWYGPRNAHRQSTEDVRAWCAEEGLAIEREHVQDAGISVIARRGG